MSDEKLDEMVEANARAFYEQNDPGGWGADLESRDAMLIASRAALVAAGVPELLDKIERFQRAYLNAEQEAGTLESELRALREAAQAVVDLNPLDATEALDALRSLLAAHNGVVGAH